MIPTFQTKFGGPDEPEERRGNCFEACLASLLHLPTDQLPKDLNNDNWWELDQGWVNQYGFQMLCLQPQWVEAMLPETYYIASGPSPRGDWLHSVVYKDGKMVHDPVNGGDGLVDGKISDIVILVYRGDD